MNKDLRVINRIVENIGEKESNVVFGKLPGNRIGV